MSLRARLIATLLVLAASGMLVLAAITYATQRTFQLDRVDDQTASARFAIDQRLDEQGAAGSGPDPGFGRGYGPGPVGRAPGDRRPQKEANLPPGTYGERRDASGAVVRNGRTVLTYGGTALPRPDLPSDLEPGQVLTVDAVGGGTEYRAQAFPDADGGLTVVAVPLDGVNETLSRLVKVEALVIAGVLLLLAALSSLLVRVGLRPLDRIGETAGAIAAGDLSRRVEPTSPRTEVGRLGLALNGMLARLERAFAEREASEGRLRQFLSDASHELRTPLASIRGYAELFRIGAARSEADVAKAMRRIEDEAARMGVLVEDLLVLARLDETREAVRGDVDLVQLVRDAAADARAMDAGREVSVRADGEAMVLGDGDQLRQVLANLVRNAVVHTPAGTPLVLPSRRAGRHVEVEAHHHGPGLPMDRPQERFG